MPSAQSSQSDQPGIHEPWFVSGSCELHRGPPRSPPRAPINFLDLYNDAGSSRRAPRTPFIDSDQQTSRTQTQTVTPLGLEPGHPDPLELSLVYLPVRDQTDPYNLRRDPPVSPPPGPINVEVSDEDDDIIILSPRSFRQALSSRRTRRTPITDVESVEISGRNQRRRVDPQPSHVNSEGTNSSLLRVEPVAPPPSSPRPLPPPPPTYSCPICFGPMVEQTTATQCGHLFCDECIRSAIAAQAKCPLCRRRITNRGLQKIFFPAPI